MRNKIYNEEISKHINWGGDENTGGLPVSGEKVQKFIKDTLNSKVGFLYYDPDINMYRCFADEESKNLYYEHPEDEAYKGLLLGSFEAPFNYETQIKLTGDTQIYKAVQKGSTGNIIEFTFNTYNKQQQPVGGLATVTYTIIRNSTKKVITETKSSGSIVSFNLDKYLDEGTNTIIIGVVDRDTLSATKVSIVYQVVNILIEDTFNISTPYRSTDTMSVPVHIKGNGAKTIEWYVDENNLEFVKDDDEVVSSDEYRTKNISLSSLGLGVGRHTLQIRAFSIVNSERFYTDVLYRDFIVTDDNTSNEPIIGVALTIPSSVGIITPVENIITPKIYDMEQYIPYDIRIASYAPSNTEGTKINVSINDQDKGTITSYNESETKYTRISDTSGNKSLKLTAGNTEYVIPMIVAEASMNIAAITNGLEFVLSAVGRNNSEDNKDQWNYGSYTGTFEGFRWDESSGWNNNRLVMPAGTSFSINYAPLSEEPVATGKTIELEFSTTNVKDDNAVICDLRGTNGTGLLITASKVSITSEGGVTAETEFKSGENIRVSFVINKSEGVTNKQLTFIYANGILSGAVARAKTDSYISPKEISITSTSDAEVTLKEIRVYNRALSSDDILNNYILYRDTIEEMTEVYNRNDVYEEGSTSMFSPNKMANRLPVMIVTGNVDVLENADTKDTQIDVNIEYINLQDSTKSFTLKNAAMTLQGTSSLFYPKKNFRIYSRKLDKTELFDYNGNKVENRLYSFKDNAQPVDCWCLKADYAESSGTHNTGLAKLWNDAFYNVKLTPKGGNSKEYVCRTNAQKAALEENYKYDVRTCIDGFPILLFYRKTENDQLIFLGKYNFNNDKSTEAVFGFVGLSKEHPEGIPGFNDKNVQCWEVLNNGNEYALFNTYNGFGDNWSSAYESRYPDTKNPDITALKNFTEWMVDVTKDAFESEKWNHMDVYKMAAYYVYIMRHAAVDQTVKNAMFTTEDGQHFYYILYDNDTTNGLINTGIIKVKPTDDRQTVFAVVDGKKVYTFAGHDSKLWNMLEADTEFMSIVKEMDRALYTVGISYDNVIKVLDKEQADKWVERVYNQDAQYKYIGPYNNKSTNYLSLLQGKRDLHRKWWLAKRFAKYDAEFVSGDYAARAISFKLNGLPAGDFRNNFFSITAGYSMKYGYGVNNIPKVSGIEVTRNETYTFGIPEDSNINVINVGDPVSIYGAPYIKSLNLSAVAGYLNTLDITYLNDNLGVNNLTELILGRADIENTQLESISGLKVANKLEKIDIRGFKAEKFKTLDLSEHKYIKEVEASGSGITSLTLAKGSPVTKISLPLTVTELVLEQLPISSSNLIFDNINTITKMDIKGCPSLGNDFDFIYDWFKGKNTESESCSLVLDNVNWENIETYQFINLCTLGTIKLKGKIILTESLKESQITTLFEKLGNNIFDAGADLYIQAPINVYILGPTSLMEGETKQYSCVVTGSILESATFTIISGGNSYMTLDSTTGVLTTSEGAGGTTITVQSEVSIIGNDDPIITTMETEIIKKVYPQEGNVYIKGDIELNRNINETSTYTFLPLVRFNIDFEISWSLNGFDGYADITEVSPNGSSCTITTMAEISSLYIEGTIEATFIRTKDKEPLYTYVKPVKLLRKDIASVDERFSVTLNEAGLTASYMCVTIEEASRITIDQLNPSTSNKTSIFGSYNDGDFSGFRYFTSITNIDRFLFDCDILYLPNTVTSFGGSYYMSVNKELVLNEGLISLSDFDTIWCYGTVYIPDSLIDATGLTLDSGKGNTIVIGGKNVTTPPSSIPENNIDGNIFIESSSLRYVYAPFPFDPYSLPNKFIAGGNAGLPTTIKAPSGGYFEGYTTQQDIIFKEINPNVYEVTNTIYYTDVKISTNGSAYNPDFKLTYTNQDNKEVQTIRKAGTYMVPIKYGTSFTVSALTEIEHAILPADKVVDYSGYILPGFNIAMNYTDNSDIYINHIDGTNYTTEAWTAGGFSNEDANGVAVVGLSHFVIAKTDVSSKLAWGGYKKTITGVADGFLKSAAVLDHDGAGNTPKIIEQCNGYSSSGVTGAPAAEGCVGYTFPNGKTGYLGALGEWQAVYNNKTKVNEAMSLIGGTAISNSSYWSSTQRSGFYSWQLSWKDGALIDDYKDRKYYVRAFCLLS